MLFCFWVHWIVKITNDFYNPVWFVAEWRHLILDSDCKMKTLKTHFVMKKKIKLCDNIIVHK